MSSVSALLSCCLEIIFGPPQNNVQDSEKPLNSNLSGNDVVVELQPISTPAPTPPKPNPLSYAAQAASGTTASQATAKPPGKASVGAPTVPSVLSHETASLVKEQYKSADSIPAHFFNIKNVVLLGEATKIIDGDTIKFYHKLDCHEQTPRSIHVLKEETLTVRLAGIDCPETQKPGKEGQPFGDEALDFLQGLIGKKSISIQLLDRDQYGRIVARVMNADGADCSLILLQKGLAYMYTGKGAVYGGQESLYKSAMEAAKSKRIGVWSLSNPQSPADYKRAYKNN